jgi:phospholipase, patatin family
VPPVELDGVPACSGSLVDPVPVDLVADVPGQTLVLTTRTYNRKTPVFALEGRLYVQPSVPLPVGSWDFTSPQRFLKAYEQGRVDAESFLKLFGLGAFRPEAQFGGALLVGAGWTEAPDAAESVEAAGKGATTEEATSGGKAAAERSADADAVAEAATGAADDAGTDDTSAAERPNSVSADEPVWSPEEGADLPVGIGNDRESQIAAQASWEDEIDDDPLTLSDDRTVGEPHDKLFERARRAREEGR